MAAQILVDTWDYSEFLFILTQMKEKSYEELSEMLEKLYQVINFNNSKQKISSLIFFLSKDILNVFALFFFSVGIFGFVGWQLFKEKR